MNLLIEVTAMLSIALVVYHHLLYPLLLKWLGARMASPLPHTHASQHTLPSISIVVPAYNEAPFIADKIRNIAALDYPPDQYRLILICDGCSDATADIARATLQEAECRTLRAEVQEWHDNQGKVARLNQIIPQLDTPITVLSDVSALLSLDALHILANRFQHPSVGVVNSHYLLLNPGSQGEDHYWRYQSDIKRSESALHSVIGCHGACYAFLTCLFKPLPDNCINDDFILPMSIVAQGYRALHEPQLHAIEAEGTDLDSDSKRRRRIAAGNLQQAIQLSHLLHPRHGHLAFNFFSGKWLRPMMPFLMLYVLIASLYLSSGSVAWLSLLALQLLAYGLAAWKGLNPARPCGRVIHLLHYLVAGHLAALAGAVRYMAGLERGRWRRVKP